METDRLGATTCPRCGARQRPAAPWCTQCFLALTGPADVSTQPDLLDPANRPDLLDPSNVLEPPGALDQPIGKGSAAAGSAAVSLAKHGWPCAGCGTANPLDIAICTACGTAFLAALHEQAEPLLVLPVIGDVLALRPALRLALAGAVIAIVALLTLLLGVFSSGVRP